MADRIRCMSQALLPVPGDYWKSCIRDLGHSEREPHVWLEAFNVAGRQPLLMTWFGPREARPMLSTVIHESPLTQGEPK